MREDSTDLSRSGSTSVAVVPFTGEDSSSNWPPYANIRSHILNSPNPRADECAFFLGTPEDQTLHRGRTAWGTDSVAGEFFGRF